LNGCHNKIRRPRRSFFYPPEEASLDASLAGFLAFAAGAGSRH
jgi:hypothetical protein